MAGQPIVIIGGGPAAAAAAGGVRDAGFDGRVVLVSEEAEVPYRRPPLSKDYLSGELNVAALPVRAPSWFDEHGVELMLGTRVRGLDEQTVVLADGSKIPYDKALIATGGRPRRLPALDHERIVYLRTIADSDLLAKRLRLGEPLVVLGAGFIGCEVAACARKLGVEVTLLEMADVPLQRVLGDRFGAIVGDVHRDAGVELRTGGTGRVGDAVLSRAGGDHRPRPDRVRAVAGGRRHGAQHRARRGHRNPDRKSVV